MGGTTPLATLPGTIIPATQQPGAVPTGQAQGAEGFLQQLMQQKQAVDAQLEHVMKNGAVPMSSAATLPSPQLLLNPVQQHQELPMDNRQVVGKHAAKLQGIGNTVTAAANIVGQFTDREQQKKNRVLAVDLERVLTATAGIQQAKDTLKTDPNNAEAKAAIEKNTQIINALMSDSKKAKQIGKALDINFTNPEENKHPEHQALVQATKSYADQLQEKIPQQMQVNPQAIQQIQMLQQRGASLEKMIDAVAPSMIRAQSVADTNAQRFQTEVMKIQAGLDKTNAEIRARMQESADRIHAMENIADKRIAASWGQKQYGEQMANARLITGIQLREQMVEQRGLSGDKQTAADQKTLKLAMDANTKATTQINSLKQLRDQLQKSEPKNPQLQEYNNSIKFWEDQLTTSGNLMKSLQTKLGGKGGTVSGTSNESAKPNISAKPVGQTEDSGGEDEDSDIYGIDSDNSEK